MSGACLHYEECDGGDCMKNACCVCYDKYRAEVLVLQQGNNALSRDLLVLRLALATATKERDEARKTLTETVEKIGNIFGHEVCDGCLFGPAPHVHLTEEDLNIMERVAAIEEEWRRAEGNLADESRMLNEIGEALTKAGAHEDSYVESIAVLRAERDAAVARLNEALPPEVREAAEAKNVAYHERNMIVAALSKLFPAWLMPHRDEPGQEWDAKWRTVVAIQLPTGQVTWHVEDAEVGLFSHLDWRTDMTWDGHDTDEKYRRLSALAARRGDA